MAFSELGLVTLIYNVSLILIPVSHNDGKILGSGLDRPLTIWNFNK